MANSCKYYKLQRQVSYDGGISWQNLDEYQKGDLYERDSSSCGYMTVTRWVNTGTTCVEYDKYYLQVKEISYDGGATWNRTTETGQTLAEANSTDCGYVPPVEPQYRWVRMTGENDYYCSGTTKMTKEKQQSSTDGVNWTDTGVYRTGTTVIETESLDCGYVYTDAFMFSDKSTTTYYNASSASVTKTFNIISYRNGNQTDLYSLVEKSTWIQYNSHTATNFKITVERNDTGAQRTGILTLKQNITNKTITLNVTQTA